MKQTDNARLVLHLPDASIQVNVIKIQAEVPSNLTFTRKLNLSDYPMLERSSPLEHQPHLIGLLYSTDPLFVALEGQLEMMELQGAEAGDEAFVLIHKNSRLGAAIDNTSVGLFKYRQHDLYANSSQSMFKHLTDMKALKFNLLGDLIKFRKILEENEENHESHMKQFEELSSRNKTLKQEFELTKNAVGQLSFQLNNLNDQLRNVPQINCEMCSSRPKNMLVLPCSHIVGCRQCTASRRNPVCTLCKQPVEELLEIQFS